MVEKHPVCESEIVLAVKMNGISMQPLVYDGDVVLFRSADHVKDGDIVAAKLYGSHTIRIFRSVPDGIQLYDCAGEFPPMTFTGSMLEDVEIVGVMAGLIGLCREY